MKCETVLGMLDDYVDNGLIGEEPSQVSRHLARCADCAGEAERLKALLRKARELPRELRPSRDLWPEVRVEIEKRGGGAVWRAWRWGAALAAAAVLVAVAGVLLAREWRRGPDEGFAAETSPVGLRVEVRKAEAEYERARRELVAAMDRTPGGLSAETRRVIEENMAVIDGAILEIRSSLEQDPENVLLFDMLVGEQGRALRLLGLKEELELNTW